jgi:hypothetical protein
VSFSVLAVSTAESHYSARLQNSHQGTEPPSTTLTLPTKQALVGHDQRPPQHRTVQSVSPFGTAGKVLDDSHQYRDFCWQTRFLESETVRHQSICIRAERDTEHIYCAVPTLAVIPMLG